MIKQYKNPFYYFIYSRYIWHVKFILKLDFEITLSFIEKNVIIKQHAKHYTYEGAQKLNQI